MVCCQAGSGATKINSGFSDFWSPVDSVGVPKPDLAPGAALQKPTADSSRQKTPLGMTAEVEFERSR
jgi:hypothetical protein